jgi:hypothetical protein
MFAWLRRLFGRDTTPRPATLSVVVSASAPPVNAPGAASPLNLDVAGRVATAPRTGPGTAPGEGPGTAPGEGPGTAPNSGPGTAPGQGPGTGAGAPTAA